MADNGDALDSIIDQAGSAAPASALPADPRDDLIDQTETPEEIANHEKYGTFGQQLKTLGEGAANALTFGTFPAFEVGSGLAKREDILGRREENPWVHAGGQGLGLVTGAVLAPEATAAGALEAAGALGARGVAKIAGAGLGARLGAAAVKTGIEGALFQGGDEVSKMILQDPNQTAQTAAVNVGLAGLLGGAIGGLTGGAGELWNATVGKKVGSSLETAAHAANDTSPIAAEANPQPSPPESFSGGPDVPTAPQDIKSAADRLGIKKLTPNMLTDNPAADTMADVLRKSPNTSGQYLNDNIVDIENTIKDAGKKTLEDKSGLSRYQAGEKLKEGTLQDVKDEYKPIVEGYKAMEGELQKAPVTLGDKMQIAQAVESGKNYAQIPELKAIGDDLVSRLKTINNVDDLKTIKTWADNEASKAYRAGDMNSFGVYKDFTNAMKSIRESALKSAAESGAISKDAFEKITNLDSMYRALKVRLKGLGVEAGLGDIKNVNGLIQKFDEKISGEALTKRLFDSDDFQSLTFFKENFPKQYELAKQHKLQEMFNSSLQEPGHEASFSLAKYRTQVNKLRQNSPEAFNELFAGKEQTINDINTVARKLPKDFNPTNSGRVASWTNFLSPKGIGDELTGAAQYAWLKMQAHLAEASGHVGGGEGGNLASLMYAANTDKGVNPTAFKQMATYIGNTIKGETLVGKATSNFFKAGKEILPSQLVPSAKEITGLDDKLKKLQENPTPLFESGGQIGHYLPDHGTAIAQTNGTAVNYLNSLRPDTTKKGPMDSEPVVSKAQQAKFNRALAIAQQPLLVIKAAHDGTITPDDVKHLQNLYPSGYARLRDKMTNEMITHVSKGEVIPYKQRLGLSIFLGAPLDSTMNPQGIMSAQPQMQKMPQSQQQQAPRQQHSFKGLDKLPNAYRTPSQARQAGHLNGK